MGSCQSAADGSSPLSVNQAGVEDIKRNLEPASKMGMATVWINNNLKINKLTKSNKFVDLEVKSLIDFLQKITLN